MIKPTKESWKLSTTIALFLVIMMGLPAALSHSNSAEWTMSYFLANQVEPYIDASGRPQILLRIEPPTPPTSVHVYGTDKASDNNRTKLYFVGPSGVVGIDGYKDGTLICFVAVQSLALEAAVRWYEKCHHLDEDEHSLETIDVDLQAMTRPRRIRAKAWSSPDRPVIPMASSPAVLTLVSQIELGPLNHGYSYDRHHSILHLLTDDLGSLSVWTNAPLTGSLSMGLSDGTRMAVDVDLNEPECEARLFAECLNGSSSNEPMLSHPISWTEALGLNRDIPTRQPTTTNEAGSWQRINRHCEDDSRFPGHRYENPSDPSLFGLVLIFDSVEALIGVQMAVPKALADGAYDYANSPYYIEGPYNGEPAFFITLYMDDREDVCRPKSASQVLCGTSTGQEAHVVTKTDQVGLFKRQADAMANGWHLQRVLPSLGSLMAPHAHNMNADINSLPPYLAAYRNGALTSLTFLHFVSNAISPELKHATIFEKGSDPSDLFINAPADKLNVVKSNFYFGNKGPRDFAHEGDSLFYIKVKDDRQRAVEGALITLLDGQKAPRAAQMVTDRHGNAFVVFEGHVREIAFSLENPTAASIASGKLWKSLKSYSLSPSRHRQTVHVETIKSATVHVDVQLDLTADLQFKIWTDKSDGKHWHKSLQHGRKIEPFFIGLDASEIHILAHDQSSIIYHKIDVDCSREVKGSRGLDIYASIKSAKKSVLKVEEIQSGRGLSGAKVEIEMGVAHLRAQTLQVMANDSVHIDSSEDGILVGWRVYGPASHLPDIGTGITPFRTKARLLKTVDLKVHVCLLTYDGGPDENGSEKDAKVEAILEYGWASQDDSHEITMVDFKGDVFLKTLPSPQPGESLNVTLISRLGPSQTFFPSQKQAFHQPIAQLSTSIHHDAHGIVHLTLCHELETVVVVVSNAATNWKMAGVQVRLTPDQEQPLELLTNEEGAAFFSFDQDHRGQKFYVDVQREHYDPVHVSRFTHASRRTTQIIHITMYPRKTLRVQVNLGSHHHHHVPAVGAVVDWAADDDGGIMGVNGQGVAELVLSGKSETIQEVTAFIPWQSTCGHSKDEDRPRAKEVYGKAELHQQHFPLQQRPPFEAYRALTLPKISQMLYQLDLDGIFPSRAELHTDLMNTPLDIGHSILHDKATFHVQIGATRAHLLLQEDYTATVVLTPLSTCFNVDLATLAHDNESIAVRHSVFHGTAKVTLKMVDRHNQPFTNASLDYVLAETAFGHNFIEPDDESGELVFHVPEGMLVHVHAVASGHVHPDPGNPSHFIATDGLVIRLIFGGSRYMTATVKLNGDGFEVPEGTMAKYVTRDLSGDSENRGLATTKRDGSFDIQLTLDTAYIDFAIGGSDGFDPVFFQPFEYVHNISRHHENRFHIEIPVKSIKNVIVSVKDCLTGDVIDAKSLIRFPEDSPVQHSWYDTRSMVNRHTGYTDRQGMAFFHLDRDILIPVQVSAPGYTDFSSRISVASNATYLVEASLCKMITITIRLVDKERQNHPVRHAIIAVSIDHDAAEFQITTDEQGLAKFGATTAMRHLSLQTMNADEAVRDPEYILHDDHSFLNEGLVDIEIKERMFTIELATASCTYFKHFSDVPVLIKIDDHTEFVRYSDEHGIVRFRMTHDSSTVVAKVMSKPDHLHANEQYHHSSIGLMPVDDLPRRFHFKFVSLPVLVSLKLMDAYNGKRPVAYATVGVRLNDDTKFFEVVTDKEGRAMFNMPTSTHSVTLQVLDAPSEVVEPVFELRDDCSDFLDSNNVAIRVLERMYTIEVATMSCRNFHHYSEVPVLVNIGYGDRPTRHANIHEQSHSRSQQWLLRAHQGYDHEKHLTDYILHSNSEGFITLRLHESAANVTLTVLAPPPDHDDIADLGLMLKEELPDKFELKLYSFPKQLSVQVKRRSDNIFGAEIQVKYYDKNRDDHAVKRGFSDRNGKAIISVDGCVEFASFTVTPPPWWPNLRAEKELDRNIMTDQEFRFDLGQSNPDGEEEILVTIKTDQHQVDVIKYTTAAGEVSRLRRADPFLQRWQLKARRSDTRLTLLAEATKRDVMGLTLIHLCGAGSAITSSLFADSTKVTVYVEDYHRHPAKGVEVIWHLGYGLGQAKTRTGTNGKTYIFAPIGELLVIEAKAHYCSSGLAMVEANPDEKVTLKCQ